MDGLLTTNTTTNTQILLTVDMYSKPNQAGFHVRVYILFTCDFLHLKLA